MLSKDQITTRIVKVLKPKRFAHNVISEKIRNEIFFTINVIDVHMPVIIEELPDALNQRRIAIVCNQLNNALTINLNRTKVYQTKLTAITSIKQRSSQKFILSRIKINFILNRV